LVSVGLIIADASLEAVPEQILTHPSVRNHALRIGKKPTELLLDQSYHHSAMIAHRLEHIWKRGRPDLVHFALVAALATPLYLKNKLDVYVYTTSRKVILIDDSVRFPKSYFRFEGLMMKLFKDQAIRSPIDNRKLLEVIDDVSFDYFMKDIVGASKSIGLSSHGIPTSAQDLVSKNIDVSSDCLCAIVIGGFPKGRFSNEISNFLGSLHSIANLTLEAHVVISRVLYECEKIFSIS
jgi:rRNA small subunit pseudouridine methyltransferase Nep1